MITVNFEKNTADRKKNSLTNQLYMHIRKQILEGEIKDGEKLPSKRNLAEHLGISVITVQNAYERLIDEGWIFSLERKGFFASDLGLVQKKAEEGEKKRKSIEIKKEEKKEEKVFADFSSKAVNTFSFPFSLWIKTMKQVLNTKSPSLLERSGIQGRRELRMAICSYLKDYRGLEALPDQVVIGAGSEILYGMLVQFFGRNKIYGFENPGYRKISNILSLNGAKALPLELDSQGLKLKKLYDSKADIIHVSPNHHFPTGTVTSVKRRQELLFWAQEKDRFIIEDDYDSEFRFRGKPLPPLQSLDKSGKVIYMNTFSKTLSPSFRISYIVLPEKLTSSFLEKMGSYSCSVSAFDQFTLERFISEGNYSHHIRSMKNIYRNIRNDFIQEMSNQKLLKSAQILEADSGLHFLLKAESSKNENELKESLKKEGIKLPLIKDFYFPKTKCPQSMEKCFVVNYSALEKENLKETVRRLKKALFE